MKTHRVSYLKTVLLFAALAFLSAAALAASIVFLRSGRIAAVSLTVTFMACTGAVVVAGCVALYRDVVVTGGRTDLFLRANRSRREQAVLAWPDRMWRRMASGLRRAVVRQAFVIGDVVEVLSAQDIAATLDAKGCLDGLPFQPEMLPFCGRRLRVFRNVDKILDYGGTQGMRRIRNVVTLIDVRCDGGAHDGCQARCYLLWDARWLRRVPARPPVKSSSAFAASAAAVGATSAPTRIETASGSVFNCQFTELAAITKPIAANDGLAYLRPLLSGNVTFSGFVIAALTRIFNRVQEFRSGAAYPPMRIENRQATPTAATGIPIGARVRVLPLEKILETLDGRGKNRGMGFPREMAKYCGQAYRVETAVSRIIDDASGKMLTMKYPCLVLKDVYASGETEMLCGQHELIYWREVWLEKLS